MYLWKLIFLWNIFLLIDIIYIDVVQLNDLVQNSMLRHYTGYQASELCECINGLCLLYCNGYHSSPSIIAIREKYSQHKVRIPLSCSLVYECSKIGWHKVVYNHNPYFLALLCISFINFGVPSKWMLIIYFKQVVHQVIIPLKIDGNLFYCINHLNSIKNIFSPVKRVNQMDCQVIWESGGLNHLGISIFWYDSW